VAGLSADAGTAGECENEVGVGHHFNTSHRGHIEPQRNAKTLCVLCALCGFIYRAGYIFQQPHPPPPGVAARIAEHPGAGISI